MSNVEPGVTKQDLPYRDSLEALHARKAAIDADLDKLRARAAELNILTTRESELLRERATLDAHLRTEGQKRGLPLLQAARVASPCSASWDNMVGDEQVRHCSACDKNVYNLSAMTSADAESLLRANVSGELCIRFYRRADGTVMTVDCPVGVRTKRRKQLVFAAAGAGALAMTAATAALTTATQGREAPAAIESEARAPLTGTLAHFEPEVPNGPATMGSAPPPQSPKPPPKAPAKAPAKAPQR